MNCLSIDVEEYFHCEVFARRVPASRWVKLERRAAPFLERLAALLLRYDSRATFFVLGWTVQYLKPLLRELLRQGHEIACHGDMHTHLTRLTPVLLREDLRRARGRIEDALGVRPRGYRAPTFSITHATAWALDVIAAEGFHYDASIFPIRHDRYGVPNAPVGPFWAEAPSGLRLLEFPPLTLDTPLGRIPVGGGGYLRLWPAALLRRCIARRQRRGQPVMIYLHPWELDPNQPRLLAGRLAQWRHRLNLGTTQAKLEQLLAAFRFAPAQTVLAHLTTRAALPVFRLRGARASRSGADKHQR